MPEFDIEEDRTAEPRWAETLRQNRIRDAVYREVIHHSWGCQLWVLERLGHVSKDQREAGDAYFAAYHANERAWSGRIENEEARKHYRALWDVLGAHVDSRARYTEPWKERMMAHEVIVEEAYPGTEMDKARLRNALDRVRFFLRIGTK